MLDSDILDKQSKSHAIFWGVLAALLAVFIAVSWYGGVKAAVYMSFLGVVLYLGYRFFH
jgi:asparagine N-glycosylation enzyme membrane subunit Stt3